MDAAVLVIDMQNGFLDPHGSSPKMGFVTPNADKLVSQSAALLSEARSAGLQVVYTRHQYRPGSFDMPASIRSHLPEGTEALVAGSWDAAIAGDLTPSPRDIVIDKNRFDAFLYTDAELVLRTLKVRRLLVTGVVTYICVESTVRSAQQRDFEVTVASDCVGGPEQSLHEAALATMGHFFAKVTPWREGLAQLV